MHGFYTTYISDLIERGGGPKSYMVRLASISPPFPFCRNATSVLSSRYNYATLRGNISHNCFPMHVYIMGAHDMWVAHRSLPPVRSPIELSQLDMRWNLSCIITQPPMMSTWPVGDGYLVRSRFLVRSLWAEITQLCARLFS